ncbi:hypothetical protein [Salinisphaera sp. T31B1]|uniref:hypothetical protein n=1 Tax=Salinisphaera sp. T31B1 TaxID=727963 RepID=UPI003341C858
MTTEPQQSDSLVGAKWCYFLLAFPAAAAVTTLFGMGMSSGPQNRFEGSGGLDVLIGMLMAYGIILAVICASYPAFRGRRRTLYIANGVLALMSAWLLWQLGSHGLI